MTKLQEFESLAANHLVVPVIGELPLGSHTPVGLFDALAGDRPGTFMLESAVQGVWARYSFIGLSNHGTLIKEKGKDSTWIGDSSATPKTQLLEASALGALNQLVEAWSSERVPGVPPLTSGLVGLLSWDVIREIEKLPNRPQDRIRTPEMVFCMFRDLVIVDHHEKKLLLVANVFQAEVGAATESDFDAAMSRIDEVAAKISKLAGTEDAVPAAGDLPAFVSNREPTEFLASIEAAKEYVRIGDVFQVVLSQRFDTTTEADPLEIYRALRHMNPSPYMYLLNLEDEGGRFSVVGSSPEALVTVTDGHAAMHPIAGSRPRGATPELDLNLEQSLVADAKEQAEHLMLVDLARNDLLKVCESSSVTVTEFAQVHRFSHIMHLVSTVEGDIRQGQNAVDVFKATFPAGTLSGAPKPRALEIIDELEPDSRGLYGGVVGYFDFSGEADLAIAIRTVFLRDGQASVQAGAGLVLDSVPESEFQETIAKASAPLRAVSMAEGSHS
jgi:anthranilate synthase component 1